MGIYKKLFKTLFPVILSILILYIFLRKTPINEIKIAISSLSVFSILLYIFLSLIGTLFRTIRYKILLSHRIGFKELFLITLVRNFSVDLLPARAASFLFYTYLTNKNGVKLEDGGTSFIISMIYDIISLSILLSIAFLYLGSDTNSVVFFFLIFILFFISFIILYLWAPIIHYIERIGFVNNRVKLKTILINIKIYFAEHNSNKERFIILFVSLLIRMLKYLSIFIIFKDITNISFGLKNISIFSFGLSATELSSIIPIQGIAGFGTWEIAFKYVFEILKLNIKNPFLIGLIIHSITQLWEYSIGIIAFLFIYYRSKFVLEQPL